MNRKTTSFVLGLALLVAAYFAVSTVVKAAEKTAGDSEEVSKLFAEAKAEAHELESDAENLTALMRSSPALSWQTHSAKLSMISEHINRTGRLLAELNQARDGASPWQQKAIDEVYPLLKELADNTQATINHLSDNKDRFHVGSTFSDYVTANYNLSRELASLITDYVEYGKHQTEFQRLQDKLQVPE